MRRLPRADKAVRAAQQWLAQHLDEPNVVAGVVEATGVAERTFKRRFKAATGSTIIAYAQNLRIEEAKRRLEVTDQPADEIAVAVGYENPAFFRRLFRRYSGLTPGQYRQMLAPMQPSRP